MQLNYKLSGIIFAALLATSSMAASSRANKDIIKLIKAGLGEVVITQAVDASTSQFDTSVEAILELKRNGASDNVISRIISRSTVKVSSNPSMISLASGQPATGGKCHDDAPPGFQAVLDEGRQRNIRPAASSSTLPERKWLISLETGSKTQTTKLVWRGLRGSAVPIPRRQTATSERTSSRSTRSEFCRPLSEQFAGEYV